MRAIVFDGKEVRIEDRPIPVPRKDEVLVRVCLAGLCETDLQLVKGYMGFRGVLGHEFVGVAESGKFSGQRVVGEINCSCSECDYCLHGLATHCPNRSVLGILNHDGAFAEFVTVPEKNLHLVPDHVKNEEAVFTEPIAAAFQIIEQVAVKDSSRVIVLGDGRLGNLCAQVLASTGCHLTVLGKHLPKLQLIARNGISTAVVSEFPGSRVADIVVDCTGSSSGMELALKLLKPRGILVMKTTVAGNHSLSLAPIVIDEISVVGSRCGPFPPALAALAEGRLSVEPLIDGVYSLDDGLAAFVRASTTPTMKLLFKP